MSALWAQAVPEGSRVDWVKLRSQHESAMQAYAAGKGSFSSAWKATETLESASIKAALAAPVNGISAGSAAAILNDYGFLLSKRSSDEDLMAAEKYLVRAIEIDPNRKLAYLNLADLLRARLRAINTFEEKMRESARIEVLYKKYVSLAGSSNEKIESFLDRNLSKDTAANICVAIADYSNLGRLDELFSPARNVNVGGVRLDIDFTTQGTAHVPYVEARDSASGAIVEDALAIPDEESLWGGDDLGLIVYKNNAQILHYRDLKNPVSTSRVNGDDSDCRFKVEVIETVVSGAENAVLCNDLRDQKDMDVVAIDAPSSISYEQVKEWGYEETSVAATNMLDIANDGDALLIGMMDLVSGAGAGCDARFFEALDAREKKLLKSSRRELLLQMQGISGGGRHFVPHCGNDARFIRYQGKVYYENKPGFWPPRDEREQYHWVRQIRGGQVVDVCKFSFKSIVSP